MCAASRSVLITGGGRGLGRAIGERLAEEGWAVGLLSRTEDQVEAAAESIREAGGHAKGLVADVLDAEDLGRALDRFADWAGRLDALVCAAGRFRGIGPIVAVDPSEWWGDVETPLRGGANAVRAAWPWLKSSPEASITMLVGPGHNGEMAFGSGYGAAQAALVRLAESLGREFRDRGLPVYALNPGLVPTDMVRHLLDSSEGRRWLPGFTEAFAEGKEVGPEVVADMAAWLLDRRPMALSGRVVAAPISPTILETRLGRIEGEDLGRLRMR
jgi:NAD(P)-dependent dehydrogenase (short-subunit alcohol dehydrogenase family)